MRKPTPVARKRAVAPPLSPAQKAARTKARMGTASDAARKAWATRRAMASAPSKSAASASEFAQIIASLRRIERALAA